ncbi:MAG: NRDE family protein [Phycisphaerales bacterium]
MCTVTIISGASADGVGMRVVCNRDESRSRPPAMPPKWREVEDMPGARAIWPMDLEAGGTWIAAAESGLVLCLLNVNPEPPPRLPRSGLQSRGLVIPSLIGLSSPQAVVRRLSQTSLKRFAPFRLVAMQSARAGAEPAVAEVRWDRAAMNVTWRSGAAACFVSSGLGDSLAAPRLELFDDLVVTPGPTAERQDEFHRHQWADRPEISVLMSRAEARTVSISTLEVTQGGTISMRYEPVPATPAAVP